MALLAIDDAVIYPREIEGLVFLARDGLAEAIKEHTDRRREKERELKNMAGKKRFGRRGPFCHGAGRHSET